MLRRKAYLSEDNVVTVKGAEIYSAICKITDAIDTPIREMQSIPSNQEDFKKWWEIFPPTDGWKSSTTEFDKTRVLRTSREACYATYNRIVREGISSDKINKATEIHIAILKKQSRRGENKLSFLQNSATYLRNKVFEAFIEDIGKEQIDSSPQEHYI